MPTTTLSLPYLLSSDPTLAADHPLMLFGQFVGSWSIKARYYFLDKPSEEAEGEVHFAWALDGKAVQDVWCTHKQGGVQAAGTTLRYFDPEINAMRCLWLAPGKPILQQFIARQIGDEIVLEAHGQDKPENWIYSQITPASFHWRAEEIPQHGGDWFLTEEMWVSRLS